MKAALLDRSRARRDGRRARHEQRGNRRGTVRPSRPASNLGPILVDSRGRTLYLFEKDTRGRSHCAGACATYWPPLLTRAQADRGTERKQSLLGVARRADGTTQVTYAGHPLYRFVQDIAAGPDDAARTCMTSAPAGTSFRGTARRSRATGR